MYSSEQLLSPDLDPDAYLRYALHAAALAAEQARLASCAEQVKADMQGILADHADGMVGHLQATNTAQRDVAATRQSIDSLGRATDRLRLMIEDPFRGIQGRITELANTNEAVDILRNVLKFLSLSSRLQEQMGGSGGSSGSKVGGSTARPSAALDVARAARSLRELEDLCTVADIRSIDAVEARMGVVERFSTAVRLRAHELLSVQELLASNSNNGNTSGGGSSGGPVQAVVGRAVLDMGASMQCAFTLGGLTKAVQTFMMERKRDALKAIMRELDAQGIAAEAAAAAAAGGGGRHGNSNNNHHGMPSSSSSAPEGLQFTQTALLGRIQSALYTVAQQTQCALLLWRVLLWRQDALTLAPFFPAVEAPVQLLLDYWNAVMDSLRERLLALQRRPDFEAALTAGYPRFRQLLASLLSSSGDLAAGSAAAVAVTTALGTGPHTGGGGGGDAAGGSSASSASSSVWLLTIQKWGLGDYLDLLQVVDAAASSHSGGGGGSGALAFAAAAAATHSSSSLSPSSSSSVEALRSTWLSLVTEGLQRRFSALLTDRHQEKMHPILARLAAITPPTAATGGQPAVAAGTATAASAAAAATTLDPSVYTRLATQDCHLYREDPLALSLAVGCVLHATQQLLSRMREATARHPLPPLPSVTATVTRAQMLHLCIANCCTTLVHDLTSVLALLPDTSSSSRGGMAAANPMSAHLVNSSSANTAIGACSSSGGGGSAPVTVADPGRKQRQLADVVDALRVLSETGTLPFLSSARVTLLPAVGYCVEVAVAAAATATVTTDNRALLQLRTRLDVFLNNYFLLVDPRTSEWAEGSRRLTDTLVARLLARCATVTLGDKAPPPPPQKGINSTGATNAAMNCALANCVQEAIIVILAFAAASQGAVATTTTSSASSGSGGGVGRSTLMLKGAARQTELLYTTLSTIASSSSNSTSGGGYGADGGRIVQELQSIVRPLFPLLARLLLIQQMQMQAQAQQQQQHTSVPSLPPPPALSGANVESLTEALEQGLMRFCQSSRPPPTAVADQAGLLSDEALAGRTEAAGQAVATYFQALCGGGGGGGVLVQTWQSIVRWE